MGVDVDEPGRHVAAGGVDLAVGGGPGEVAQRDDSAVVDADVRVEPGIAGAVEDPAAQDMLNIFIESSDEFFAASTPGPDQVVLGQTSPIASQPEFATNERLRELIALTEQKELLAKVLGTRADKGVPFVTIGSEHGPELAGFTLVTSGYRFGSLRGILGVIGPTRMPYEKVIAIVDYTSSLVTRMLEP